MANFDLGQLIYRITGDNSDLKKVLKDSEGKISGFGGVMKGVGKNIAGIFGALGVGFALKDMITKAAEAEKNMAKLNQVIKATGGAAGVTSEYAQELANSLSSMSEYADDDILAAETLLLKFKNIGKDVFPDATQAVLDLSAAMGQDLNSSAQMLGKALQDPTTGMNLLKRAGIDLSAEQKKQIESFMRVGDVASAQKVLLTELSKVVGGQAAVAADTFSGRLNQLRNSFEKLEENLGSLGLGLKSVFEGWAIILNGINNAIDYLVNNTGANVGATLDGTNRKIKDTKTELNGLYLEFAKMKAAERSGADVDAQKYNNMSANIKEAEKELGKLYELQQKLKESSPAAAPGKSGITDEQMKGIEEYNKAQAESYKALGKMNADYQMQKAQLEGDTLRQIELEEAAAMQTVYDLKLAKAIDTEEALKQIHEVYLKKKEQAEYASALKIAQAAMSLTAQFTGQMANIVSMYYQNQQTEIENNKTEKLDAINETYEAEVARINALPLSEEEKNEKLKALDEKKKRDEAAIEAKAKKAGQKLANEQFKIQKAISIIQATNQGISSALSSYAYGTYIGGPPVGAIMAGISMAFTSAQIALLAAQPTPKYAAGGIIPGDPSTGDNTLIRATPGELILNQAQQANVASRMGGTIHQTIYLGSKLLYDDLFDASQNGELMIDKRAVVGR